MERIFFPIQCRVNETKKKFRPHVLNESNLYILFIRIISFILFDKSIDWNI